MGGDDDGIVTLSSLIVGSDGGDGGSLNNLLRCIRCNQGIGSLMSSGSSGTIGGGGTVSVRDSLGITESVVGCGTVGVTVIVESSVGITELAGDSGTVVSAGVSVEVIGSVDCLSLVPMLWLVRNLLVPKLGPTGSW